MAQLDDLRRSWRPDRALAGHHPHWPFAALYRETTRRQIALAPGLALPDFQYALIDHFFRLYHDSVVNRLMPRAGRAARQTPLWDRYFHAAGALAGRSGPPHQRMILLGARAHIEGDLAEAIVLAWQEVSADRGIALPLGAVERTLFSRASYQTYYQATLAFLDQLAALRLRLPDMPAWRGWTGRARWLLSPSLLPVMIHRRRQRAWHRAQACLAGQVAAFRSRPAWMNLAARDSRGRGPLPAGARRAGAID